MKISKTIFCFAVLCASTIMLVGCGGGGGGSRAGLVDAAGTVVYNGELVADAVIEMRPVDETVKNCVAVGRTDAQGAFTLTTDRPNDGAMPGKYKTVVKKQVEMIDGMTREEYIKANDKEGNGEVIFDKDKLKTENMLPAKYSDPINTPLEIEIPSGGNKKIEIVLED